MRVRWAAFYLSLSDYVQHAHAPGAPEADAFNRAIDDRVRRLVELGAVEFAADKKGRTFFDRRSQPHRIAARHALEEGAQVRALPYADVNSFSPPLCIARRQIDCPQLWPLLWPPLWAPSRPAGAAALRAS